MITVTRLNHKPLIINSDLIEQIEMTPDTVISLTTGEKIMVLETSDQLVERIVNFRRSIAADRMAPAAAAASAATHAPPEEADGGR